MSTDKSKSDSTNRKGKIIDLLLWERIDLLCETKRLGNNTKDRLLTRNKTALIHVCRRHNGHLLDDIFGSQTQQDDISYQHMIRLSSVLRMRCTERTDVKALSEFINVLIPLSVIEYKNNHK